MTTIFIYHVIVQFPKVHNRLNKIPLKKLYGIQRFRGTNASTSPTTHGKQANSLSAENFKNGNKRTNATFSELREPLLETGTADIYSIDPSTKIGQHIDN